MCTVSVSTILDASAETVWRAVRSPASFRFVTRGLLRLPALRGRTAPWQQGERVRSPLLLLGVVFLSAATAPVATAGRGAGRHGARRRAGPHG